MLEIIGTIATILAISGVLANNRRLRWCFIIWGASNSLSLVIHVYTPIWSLVVRDAIFLILAFEGWKKWGKKMDTEKERQCKDGIKLYAKCLQKARNAKQRDHFLMLIRCRREWLNKQLY